MKTVLLCLSFLLTSAAYAEDSGVAVSEPNGATVGRGPASEAPPSPELIDIENQLDGKAKKKDAFTGKKDAAKENSQDEGAGPISAKERKELIMKTISQNFDQMKDCYKKGRAKNPEMQGKVTFSWNIDPQGKATAVEMVSSQLKDKDVEKCLSAQLGTWKFPRETKMRSAKDRMNYSFDFVPED
jgi:hypothetical protein